MPVRLMLALCLLSLFYSCKNVNHKDEVNNGFIDSLNEKRIGQTNYWIFVPADFEIKENEGPDFSVFYFVDTTAKSGFSGGMYFGNYPSRFPPKNDSCKIEVINSEILGENSDWSLYECNGEYSVQTIVDSKSKGWNNQIHVFGHTSSRSDVYRILKIYSTFTKRTKGATYGIELNNNILQDTEQSTSAKNVSRRICANFSSTPSQQ
jgi:hypothetical protein